MRKCDKLLPWVFSGLLLFATHNSLPLAQEQTAKYDVGAEYNKRQKNLNTRRPFHSLLFKPAFHSLPFQGYLIGIEGGNHPFVSHIGRFGRSEYGHDSWTTWFLYNAYFTGDSNCENFDSSGENFDSSGLTKNAEDIGFEPIEGLADDISEIMEAQEPFTHIIVYSTGYNTAQWESLASHEDIHINLMNAVDAAEPWYNCWFISIWPWSNGCEFNPLFIGITWQSFNPTVLKRSEAAWGLDFPSATNRAKEIGEKLAVSLLEKVLLPLKNEYDLSIVLIGHSLGAKVLSQAAYSVTSDDDEPPIDLLVGLQGAFRMVGHVPRDKKYLYKHNEGRVKTTIYTTSENDSIRKYLKKFSYTSVGLAAAWDTAEVEYPDVFSFAKVDEDGEIDDMNSCGNNKPVLVDANDLIKRNPDGGISADHSDIHHKAIGTFIWNVIDNCAFDWYAPLKSVRFQIN